MSFKLCILRRGENHGGMDSVEEGLSKLKTKFASLRSHLLTFSFWPINDGREDINETTLVPDADGLYNIPKSKGGTGTKEENAGVNANDQFAFQRKIWESFVKNVSDHYFITYI